MARDEQQQQDVCIGSASSSSSSSAASAAAASSSCDKLPPLSSHKKYPWFIVQNLEEDEDDTCTEFFSTLHDPLLKFQSQIPELYRKRIRGCFYGWLLISNHADNVMWSLWNPVSLKTVNLPPLMLKDEDVNKSIRECLLTAPPDDPTCVVLLTRCDAPKFVFCHLRNRSKRKSMKWTEMSYSKQLKRLTYNGELLRNLCCCNGKIYALSTDGNFCAAVIQLVVKRDRVGEVMIQLVMFGACPAPEIHRCFDYDHFIIGGRYGKKELLFCVVVCYHRGTKALKVSEVYLFRLDTGSIKWEDLECLKKWDLTGFNMKEYELDCTKELEITQDMWEEMNDLKDTAIFYVDLGRDRTIFYNPAVASDELLGGGYVQIRDKMDGILHLYHVRDRTIIASPMPSQVVSTTHVSMWEGRLDEDGHLEANCTGSVKPEKDRRIVVTWADVLMHTESRVLDVLEMLVEHCVGVEYLNLRATCKFCLLAAPLIRWSNESSRTRLHNYSLTSPWLMVVNKHRGGGIISFTDPLSGDNYFVKKNSQVLSSIVDDRMYCSRYGWLLFESREYECPVLFNPFTSDLRKLPKLGEFGGISCLCFSASPTTNYSSSKNNNNNCIVAGFAYDEEQWYLIYYSVGVGGDEWCFVPLDGDDDDDDEDWYTYALLTFIGQDLYALGRGGQVIVFKNLDGEESMIKKTVLAKAPPLMITRTRDSQYYLMSCDDEHLILVIVGDECGHVKVFMRNDDEDKWVKIDGIGKHTIFIGGTTSVCVDAKKPEMENKIYFPQLVWYSLETHTYHASSDPAKIMKRYFRGFVGAKSHLNCHAWIQPSWR